MINGFRATPHAGKNHGFTLIELVVVIVILGLLSATALPRFVDLGTDAHRAKVEGVFTAFSGGVNLIRSSMITRRQLGNTGVVIDSVTVDVNAQGWPDNFGAGAAATNTCIAFFNDRVATLDPVAAFVAPVTAPGTGWQVLANANFCLYLYKDEPVPIRYVVYNPNQINFGALGDDVFLIWAP